MPHSSRSNLVPARVTDKNGKSTTVYKRADASTTNKVSIPQPAAPEKPYETEKAKRKRLVKEVTKQVWSIDDGTNRIASIMENYSPAMLDRIEGFLDDFDKAADVAALIQHGHSEATINECMYFMDDMHSMDFYQSAKVIRTIHHGIYPGLPEADDYSLADDEVRDKVSSLMKVTGAIYANDNYWSQHLDEKVIDGIGNVATIKDERLIALALERYEEADLIVSLIRERKTADFEVLNDLLATSPTPLVNGAL